MMRRLRFLAVSLTLVVFACAGFWRATGWEAAQAQSFSNRSVAERAIRQVFGARAPAAIRVASCETGGTFYARSVGDAGERGLFQIHPVHFSWAQPSRLFDPVWNSRVAYRLSRGGTNWRAWTCRP